MLQRAHLDSSGIPDSSPIGSSWPADLHQQTELPPSNLCLGCHDGSVATDVSHRVGFGTPVSAGDPIVRITGGHPISREYPRRKPERGGWSGYFDPADLDDRIRLFEDRIECGSCHSPYSEEEHLLVMPNHDSALCLSCHDV
jgi:predicted CXXCH cytochrome family protein